jgi:hypothetical protein
MAMSWEFINVESLVGMYQFGEEKEEREGAL